MSADEPRGATVWTVEAWLPAAGWTPWSAWVDRATAEAEKLRAKADGFDARIVRAS